MPSNKRKTVRFSKHEIEKLPNNKPVVYKILTIGGANNYTGIAKRGRVRARLNEHLGRGPQQIPGAKVQIQQLSSVEDAKKRESNIIKRTKPKYNKQGK